MKRASSFCFITHKNLILEGQHAKSILCQPVSFLTWKSCCSITNLLANKCKEVTESGNMVLILT